MPTIPPERDIDGFTQLVDQVAAAVCAVDGVLGLHAGTMPQVATLLPGRRVPGLRIAEAGCEVHITVDLAADLPATAAAVRAATRPLVGEVPVDVFVEDVATPSTSITVVSTGSPQEKS